MQLLPKSCEQEPLVILGAFCSVLTDTWKGVNDGKQ